MANDNKKLKELVPDDKDRTADLEIPVLSDSDAVYGTEQPDPDAEAMQFDPYVAPIRNRDAVIQDLKSDLRVKTETIDRLQFDIERLRSRRIGLETEVKARESQTRKLAKAVEDANRQIDTLTLALREAKKTYDDVSGRLSKARAEHEQELRILRFELTEASETAAQQELINEQLASDLVDTRGFKNQLERMLTTSEEHSQVRISQLEAEQPATTYGEFKHEILNEIARCLNMPFNVAAGNSSGYNYASGRLDHQTYFKSIRVEQAHVESAVLDRVLNAWLNEAVLVEGFLPHSLRTLDADLSHQWFWDGREHVDPAKEANAQATRLTSHTTTLANEYAKQGRDWEAELRQRAKEVALMEKLGLTTNDSLPETEEQEDDEIEEADQAA